MFGLLCYPNNKETFQEFTFCCQAKESNINTRLESGRCITVCANIFHFKSAIGFHSIQVSALILNAVYLNWIDFMRLILQIFWATFSRHR